jgi:outer membrane autotransporter protein
MSFGRVARGCAQLVLFACLVPAAHAGVTDSINKFKQSVQGSFGQAAYYPSPQAAAAVAAPTLQMNTARQRLDQLRYVVRATAGQIPRVSINGNFLPSASAAGVATNGPAGNQETGGGASADPFERWGLFINGDFDRARQSSVDDFIGFKTRTNSITIGGDYRFSGNNVLGASVGFLKSDSDFLDGGATQDAKGYGFTFFGSFVPTANAYIDAIVNVGHNNYDGLRQTADASYSSDTSGNQWGFALNAGYGFNHGALTLTPYGRVEYVNAKVNGFTETGGNGALTITDQRIKATTLALGAQASYAISTSWGVLVPNGRVEYQHIASLSRKDFTLQTASQSPQLVPLLGQDKNYGVFAVGVSGVFPNGVSAFFNYQQLFGKSDVSDRLYTVGLRIDF